MDTRNNTKILHKDLSYIIQGCCFEIRKEYGAGQKETVYVNLLKEYLESKGLKVEKEKSIKIYSSKTGKIVGSYRPDLIIEDKIPIEVKSSSFTTKQDEKQLYHYLRNSSYELGYLVNFSTKKLFIKRIIYTNDRKPFLKFLSCIFVFLFVFFSVSSEAVEAAQLYFAPQEQVIGSEGDFSVAIMIDASKPVNALSVAVDVPFILNPYDVNEGNSIINFWVDKPHFDETTRLLTFSGIIPGGFEGEKAPLLILKLRVNDRAPETGNQTALLNFDKEKTKAYLNTPDGLEDVLELEKIELPIVKGKKNMEVETIDIDAPESFKPEIAKDPNIFGGKWFLVFSTQDKGSGIAYYAIHETTRIRTRIDTKDWVEAESPYVLKDQKLRNYVYIKAIDKAGNERIEFLPPQNPFKWYEDWLWWGIIAVGIIFGYVIRRKI